MPNPNPKLENLTSYKPKWKSGKTQTIRVPITLADRVLEIAHLIDDNNSLSAAELIKLTDCGPEMFEDLLVEPGKPIFACDPVDFNDALSVLNKGLAVPSDKGDRVKNYLAKLGRMLGFDVKKNSKKQWRVTFN